MSVEMGIRHRDSGEYEVVPIATLDTFRRVWLPACEELGLELVPLFAGGALTSVPPDLVPRIIDEVLRLWIASVRLPEREHLADRCQSILAALARTEPALCEYDFG
jgi:hypothetical protein